MKNKGLSICIRNMKSGEGYFEDDKKIYSAQSIIKLPILLSILDQVSLEEMHRLHITLLEEDKVPGCGALKAMDSGMDFSLYSLAELMISLSDNTATNMLIDYFGVPWYKSIFGKMGLRDTQLNRKLFDAEKQAQGIDNYFSCDEISLLLEKIFVSTYTNRNDSYALSTDFLLKQQINHKLANELFDVGKVAHKTGESTGISHDVGVVFSDIPYTFVFASQNVNVDETEEYFRVLSRGMAQGKY